MCGAACPPPFRAPPAELAPDLDMRPGEPTRSTLRAWLRRCGGCGATAPDVAALPPEARAVIDTPAYRAADPYRRWAMLCPRGEAAEALLQAAWAADDEGRDARALRREAAAAWGQPASTQGALRLLDVLRRAGAFEEAARRADTIFTDDEPTAQIVAFQRARIAARDDGRHLLSSALRPPARMPHVAHGRPAPKLWSRLRAYFQVDR